MYRAGALADEATVCLVCGSPGPNGSTCPRCDARRAAVEPEPVMTRSCPRCATALLAIDVGTGATVHACRMCRGMFVPARAWRRVLETGSLAEEIEARLGAVAGGAAVIGDAAVRCPTCAREMERKLFGRSSEVTIDVCDAGGHGVWVDWGELSRVAAFHMTPFHRRRRQADIAHEYEHPSREKKANNKSVLGFVGFFAVLLIVSSITNHLKASKMQQRVDRAAAQSEQQLR